MRCATHPTPSQHDGLQERFKHPLGAMRTAQAGQGSRDRALFLAASLADDSTQRASVRNQAYALLGDGTDADYWLTRALRRLGDTMKDDIGLLVAQGWALRSFAAILRTQHGSPVQVGGRPAMDNDVRVRRTLAEALAKSDSEESQRSVRELLGRDPCHSVREALHART
jgi:hypothetical protein